MSFEEDSNPPPPELLSPEMLRRRRQKGSNNVKFENSEICSNKKVRFRKRAKSMIVNSNSDQVIKAFILNPLGETFSIPAWI